MGSRPVTTATERFKALLASALERVCVLEEQLELLQQQLAEQNGEVTPDADHETHQVR